MATVGGWLARALASAAERCRSVRNATQAGESFETCQRGLDHGLTQLACVQSFEHIVLQ